MIPSNCERHLNRENCKSPNLVANINTLVVNLKTTKLSSVDKDIYVLPLLQTNQVVPLRNESRERESVTPIIPCLQQPPLYTTQLTKPTNTSATNNPQVHLNEPIIMPHPRGLLHPLPLSHIPLHQRRTIMNFYRNFLSNPPPAT